MKKAITLHFAFIFVSLSTQICGMENQERPIIYQGTSTKEATDEELNKKFQDLVAKYEFPEYVTDADILAEDLVNLSLLEQELGEKPKKFFGLKRSISKQLIDIMQQKEEAQKAAFGLLCESDEEDEENFILDTSTTRINFKKWQKIHAQEKLLKDEVQKISGEELYTQKEVEKLEQQLEKIEEEKDILKKKKKEYAKNLQLASIAQNILQTKKLTQKTKMTEQLEQLKRKKISIEKKLESLKKQIAVETISSKKQDIQTQIERINPQLSDVITALTHLEKDMATTEGATTILGTTLWKLGWNPYSSTNK